MIPISRQVPLVPVARPRVTVAPDAGRAIIADGTTASVVDLARAEVLGTIEVPAGCDVGWIDAAVIVVAEQRVRVVDIAGPAPGVFDRELEVGMRLFATCEATALIGGELGCFVVTCDAGGIALHRFLARELPSVVGVGVDQFVVAFDGGTSIVEWDPVSCKARGKFTLPRPAAIAALGGTRRTVWFVARDTPSRIDVIVHVAMNQPKVHELPEPIVDVAGHPRLEQLWCLGKSGRVYVVDLDGHHRIRVVAKEVEALGIGVIGAIALVAARAGHPVEISTAASTRSPRRSAIGRPPTQIGKVEPADPTRWRDELVAWTRQGDAHGAPVAPAIAGIGARYGLPDELLPAIALGYGAHLCGEPSVPLVDVALVLGGTWEEALGRGALAASGAMTSVDSRARIAPAICRALDELPPSTGTLIGTPATAVVGGARAVVSSEPLAQLAPRLAARLECAILVGGDAAEARAYGALALTRSTTVDPRDAAIVVVESDPARLGLPVLEA